MTASRFIFVTCQIGAETALKHETARRWPELRFAYSRPGFLTFKLPPEMGDDFAFEAVFARSWGFSLGKAEGTTPDERAREVWQLAGERKFDKVHVWPRDRLAAGEHGYQPGTSDESLAARAAIMAAAPDDRWGLAHFAVPGEQYVPVPFSEPTKLDDAVLDVIVIDEKLWWVGWHRASTFAGRYPGGLVELKLPEDAVSRAYLKMEEALRWSRLPVKRDEAVAEIGCAPGGSCQSLLRRGLYVLGVDPAMVAPEVLDHPRFVQIRKRANSVRRREFRKVRWLTADMNVAPEYTLDAVEAIVTHEQVPIRGMLITLKLVEWQLADELPKWLERIRSWGFSEVRARQLMYNRQEVCVMAMRPKKRDAARQAGSKERGQRRLTDTPE